MKSPSRLVRCALWALLALTARAAEPWQPLLNGKDLTGWETWLGKPDPSVLVEGAARNEKGDYLAPLGSGQDPLHVFSVVQLEGQPVLRSSGQIFGYLCTEARFHDYHLRLEFRWGDQRWVPRLNAPRDSGLLYHVHGDGGFSSGVWPRCVEFQIQEHDCGDLYAIGTKLTAKARQQADHSWIYDPRGEETTFLQKKPIGNRCIRLADQEKPTGAWNTIELFCIGDMVTYVVNGHVVMHLAHARDDNDDTQPLAEGRIALQSEGAEVFYRNVELRPLSELPIKYQ